MWYGFEHTHTHTHTHTHAHTCTHTHTHMHTHTHTAYLLFSRIFMFLALVAGVCAWIVCVLALIQRKARWLFVSAIVYVFQGKKMKQLRAGGREREEGGYAGGERNGGERKGETKRLRQRQKCFLATSQTHGLIRYICWCGYH